MKCLSLKRNLEFDIMSNIYGSPCKRARLNSRDGRQSVSQMTSPPHTPERISPQSETLSPFGNLSSELTPEKMVTNIKEEADRLSRKKHLRFSPNQITAADSGATGSQIGTLAASANVNDFNADDGEIPMFTLEQVSYLCQMKMEEQRHRIREEYEKVLKEKKAEQYDAFLRFQHDQLKKKIASQDRPSYLS